MNFTNIPQEELSSYFTNINTYLESNFKIQWTKYLDLGVKKVRLISYSKEFLRHIERHMSYVLCDNADSYDATILIWHEEDIENFASRLSDTFNPKKNLKLRVEMMASKLSQVPQFIISKSEKVDSDADIRIRVQGKIIEARDDVNSTFYYALSAAMPEEVAAHGHLFVHALTHILRTENSGMVHSAVVGLNNKGMLFCGRSGKGKSTLSVTGMMAGFEYVSDDYLTIECENDKLYTYPIYSMISLSHAMYDKVYDRMKGKLVSNSGNKQKFVYNIAAYHEQFRTKYPVELCLFPQIVSDEEPSIIPCAKALPMFQFIHSSLEQVKLVNDKKSLKVFYNMIKDLSYYQINLCKDIDKNVECLRNFISNYNSKEKHIFNEEEIVLDIYNNRALFFDIPNLQFYSMNQFTTSIFENLQKGVGIRKLADKIKSYNYVPERIKEKIEEDLLLLKNILLEKSLLKNYEESDEMPNINEEMLIFNKGYLALLEHQENGEINLLLEKS